MATATPPRPTWSRAETDQRVRHPLHRLRGYIRTYVTLEGAAVFLIYLALWFWIGLALDYGVFKLFAYDWVQEMPRMVGGDTAWLIRVSVLVILLAGLLALVATKVILRLVREFRDRSLALVLERRFPQQLGDRLITAVEMADPKLSEKYGHSQPMVDQTIRDAADRVGQVPVKEVFNWRRLGLYGLVVAGLSLGLVLLAGLVHCLATGDSPGKFFYRGRDVAGIWAERNLLLQNSPWPRSAFLEVIRFKGSKTDKNELRIGDNNPSADLWVRASRWVIADPDATDGWRPLRWNDLEQVLGRQPQVSLPDEWAGWSVDIDDLDPDVPAYLIPEHWRGRTIEAVQEDLKHPGGKAPELLAVLTCLPQPTQPLGAALAAAALKDPALGGRKSGAKDRKPLLPRPPGVREALAKVGKYDAMTKSLFRWQNWSMDRIALQLREKEEHRKALRHSLADAGASAVGLGAVAGGGPFPLAGGLITARPFAEQFRQAAGDFQYEKAFADFDKVFADLDALVDSGAVDRQVRKLDLPEDVTIYYYGKATKTDKNFSGRGDNKFQVGLNNLTESVRFYVQGDDFYTSEKKITLVPRPRVEKMFASRWEPAYLYYRLQGKPGDLDAQAELRGKKQPLLNQPVYVLDQISRVEVPVGTDVELLCETTDLLKDRVRIEPGKKEDEEKLVGKDPLEGVEAAFVVEDGTPNRRKFTTRFENVTRTIDFVYRFTNEDNVEGERHVIIEPKVDKHPDVTVQMIENVFRKKRNTDYIMVTPLARVPFKGSIVDDRGLNRVAWAFQVTQVKADANKAKAMTVLTALQTTPGGLGRQVMGAAYLSWLLKRMAVAEEATGKQAAPVETVLVKKYVDEAGNWQANEVTPEGLAKLLAKGKRPGKELLKQITLKADEDAFSFKDYLARLKAPGDTALQPHYLVELWVTATDNNVEAKEPAVGESKQRFTFLVVGENDLLLEIFQEEEDLRDEMDKIFKRLTEAKTKLDSQVMPGLADKSLAERERNLKATRSDEVKKVVRSAGKDIGGIHAAFSRILLELEANDVQKSNIKRVDEGIVQPLKEMMDKRTGEFHLAEEAAEKLQGILEKDQPDRLAAGQDAKAKLDKLIAKLGDVLERMQKVIDKDKLIRELVEQEQENRKVFDALKAHEEYLIKFLTEGLEVPNKTKKKS